MTRTSWKDGLRALGRLLTPAALALGLAGLPAMAAERFFSATSRTDFAYSPKRDTLYIVDGSQILRYVVSTGQSLPPIQNLSAYQGLQHIDLSIDEQTLAVTDASADFRPHLILIDADSSAVSRIDFNLETDDYGTYGVAWGQDGSLLVSGAGSSYYQQPLRRVDPVSGGVKVIGSVESRTALNANSDRSTIAIEKLQAPDGSLGIGSYSVIDRSFRHGRLGPLYSTPQALLPNRDGSQFAMMTDGQAQFFDRNLQLLPGVLGAPETRRPLSAVYDPAGDRLYTPWSSSRQIRAYDPANLVEVGRFLLDRRFPSFAYDESTALIRVSADGQWLFASTDFGVLAVRSSEILPALTPDPADLPTVRDTEMTLSEDSQGYVSLPGTDPINGDRPDYRLVQRPAHGRAEVLSGNLVVYLPDPDFFGSDRFTYTLGNEAGTSPEATVTVTVSPVNDAPAYVLNRQLYRTALGGLRRTDRDALIEVRAGPANESDQQLGFAVSNNNPALFIEQPRISADGVLTYRPRLFGSGEATVTVTGVDSGGTGNGGVDRGPTVSFRIAVR